MEGDKLKRVVVLNFVILILLVVLIVVINRTYFDVYLSNVNFSHSKIILIDAGHGGNDPGGQGASGTIEKHINLSIAKKLKGYLEDQGYTSVMIRETDEALYDPNNLIGTKKGTDMKHRKEHIEEYNCDLLVSIHLNKFPEAKYYGAQVFYLKGSEEGQKLGILVQNELKRIIGRGNTRVAKSSSDYYLLKGNKIPSIIVECGFLSNGEEERLLGDDNYQNQLAYAIFSGITKYYKDVK